MCVTDPYWHPVSETQEHPQAATRHPSCVNIVYTVITSNKVNSRYSVNCSSSSKVNQQCSQMQTTRRWVLQFDCLELLARQLLSSDLWWQKINRTEFELVNIYCCCLHLVLSRWIKIDGIIMNNILCCSWSWCLALRLHQISIKPLCWKAKQWKQALFKCKHLMWVWCRESNLVFSRASSISFLVYSIFWPKNFEYLSKNMGPSFRSLFALSGKVRSMKTA